MNSPFKILSTLAIGGFLAGTAFAGPGDAHPPFAYLQGANTNAPTTIALLRSTSDQAANCPMIKEQSKTLPTVNPKVSGATTVVTGAKHEGCVTTSAGVACKGSTTPCAAMTKGN
jgi:hypothetical protein